jgi:serine protease Do
LFTRYAIPAAFAALMLAARPALAADEPGFLGLQLGPSEFRKGLPVMGVLPDGPADKAGLKPGDFITEMDGKAADELKAFIDAVAAHKPGDEVTLKVLRDGKEMSMKAKVAKRPAGPPAPAPGTDEPFVGLAIRPDPDGKGVEIRDVLENGPADKAGLKKGDVVTQLDGKAMPDPAALAGAVADHKPGDELTFKILRDGKEQQVKVKVGKRPEGM